MLSTFIKEPQFQGQTKDKLVTVEAHKLVEQAVKDHFDHWLAGAPQHANALLNRILERMERSEEHTSELQSLMRISYAVFCLKKKNNNIKKITLITHLNRLLHT